MSTVPNSVPNSVDTTPGRVATKIKCRVCPDQWIFYYDSPTARMAKCTTCNFHTALKKPLAGKIYQDCNKCRTLVLVPQSANRFICPTCRHTQNLCLIKFNCLSCGAAAVHNSVKNPVKCPVCSAVHVVDEDSYNAQQKHLKFNRGFSLFWCVLVLCITLASGGMMIEGILMFNNNVDLLVKDTSLPLYTSLLVGLGFFVDLIYLYLSYKGVTYNVSSFVANRVFQVGCMIYLYITAQDLKDALTDETKAIEGLNHWQIGSIGFMGARLLNLFALLVLVVSTQSKNRTNVLVHLAAQQPQQNVQQPNVDQPLPVYQEPDVNQQQQPYANQPLPVYHVNQQQQPYANQPQPVYIGGSMKSPLLQNNQSSLS